ncbi:Uncharacterized conserved protein [Phaffia rhodozyma]|uniref:Uncharacterized conserved protein n=1 Tax=Phaffia rhodozyma TaxID=264483 RepID=A0A0F7SK27_PHARH|nr:Uncharacterized conserved protein [Phaffia rhodozyma]
MSSKVDLYVYGSLSSTIVPTISMKKTDFDFGLIAVLVAAPGACGTDLSNGLARSLSLPLTGKQIDGIWHTSVVVFGQEVYYGQGILKSKPASTHHGAPLKIIPMGETALDEETWEEYLDGLKDHWTAEKYHLLDFNCNSFTADAIGFLTGGTIPSWISNLPSDFLSTPFGASLRPQIDAMFNPTRRSSSNVPTQSVPLSSQARPNIPSGIPAQYQGLASTLLNSVAAQASSTTPGSAPQLTSSANGSSTLTSPLQIASSSASLHSILNSHGATVVFVTKPRTCPPCRVIEPVFERLAQSKSQEMHDKGVPAKSYAFTTVDIGLGRGSEIAVELGIRATPSFVFFLGKEKIDELRGGNESELETKIDLLLYQAFPPHPHSTWPLPAVQAVSVNPILYGAAPKYPALIERLKGSLLDGQSEYGTLGEEERKRLVELVERQLVPFLETKAVPDGIKLEDLLGEFLKATVQVIRNVGYEASFPLIDLWRIAIIDRRVSTFSTMPPVTSSSIPRDHANTSLPPILELLSLCSASSSGHGSSLSRPFCLTSLRFLANAFTTVPLASLVLSTTHQLANLSSSSSSASSPREILTTLMVDNLLSDDVSLKSSAAGLAFNVSGLRHRRNSLNELEKDIESAEEGDWTLEIVIVLVEAIKLENKSEDVVYRLVSALALCLYLSPYHGSTLGPNLEVLGAKDTIEQKTQWVKRKEILSLISDVGGRLC